MWWENDFIAQKVKKSEMYQAGEILQNQESYIKLFLNVLETPKKKNPICCV